MIKGLIFDFAGVIGTDGYWIFLRDKVSAFDDFKPYFQKLSEQVDKGEITNQQFKEKVANKIGIPVDNVWPEISERIIINRNLLKLIENWKRKYKICLLTNYTRPWLEQLFLKYSLSPYFDLLIVSSDHKIIKPDVKIYRKVLELLKLNNDEVVFIDDRQKNIDGGENAGIKSLLFTSNEKLLEDLKKLGVDL